MDPPPDVSDASFLKGGLDSVGDRPFRPIGKGKRRKTTNPPKSGSARLDDTLLDVRFEALSSVEIGEAATDWLTQVDELRVKSGNIQGGISGQMKARIAKAKMAIQTLVERTIQCGNNTPLRKRNALSLELYSANRRIENMKREHAYLESRILEKEDEIRRLRDETELLSAPDRPVHSMQRATQTSPGLGGSLVGSSGQQTRGRCPPTTLSPVDGTCRNSLNPIDEYSEAIRGLDERLIGCMA